MRKLRRLLTAAVLSLVATGLPAQAAIPEGFSVSATQALRGGVEFLTLARPAESPAIAYVARLGRGDPVSLRAVSSHDRIPHHGDELELPSSMCQRVNCIAAVNADFHFPNHESVGGVVSGGRMIRSPIPSHAQISVTPGGRLVAGVLPWSGAITTGDGTTIGLGGINVSQGLSQVVLYTPDWGAKTRTSSGVELVLRTAGPVGTLGRPSAVEVVGLNGPGSAIPTDGAVLSGSGAGAAQLRDLWSRIQQGRANRQGELRVDSPVAPVESLGVNPVLLRDGQPVFPPATDGFTVSRHPRTLVGWNPAGEVFLVAVDGRRTDSKGMTLADGANLLLGLGATDGVNFDGGGGTTFVVDGAVANQPSDDQGDDSVAVEREAVNSLVVVAQPPPPPPLPGGGTTPPPGGGTGGPAPGLDGTTTTTGSSDPSTTTTAGRPDGGVDDPDSVLASAAEGAVGLRATPTTSRGKSFGKGKGSTGGVGNGQGESLSDYLARTKDGGLSVDPSAGNAQDLALGDDTVPGQSRIPAGMLAGALLAGGAAAGLSLTLRARRRHQAAMARTWWPGWHG